VNNKTGNVGLNITLLCVHVNILQWRNNYEFCVCYCCPVTCHCQLYKNTEHCTTLLLW